jgi:hypothetical protein
MLSPDERALLESVSHDPGRGGFFVMARMVAELSERHPILALEQHPKYPTFESLPAEYKAAIRKLPRDAAQRLEKSPKNGHWPDYAIEVTEQLRRFPGAPKKQLGPATAADFGPAVEEFVRGFTEKLQAPDKARLKSAETHWPDYPKVLQELAREYKVAVPELSLPGEPQRWEAILRGRRPGGPVANALPDPPEYLLRQFALQLNKQDPNGPRLSLMDPQDREVIKQKFFEANPGLLETLRAQDREKRGRPGKGRPPGP